MKPRGWLLLLALVLAAAGGLWLLLWGSQAPSPALTASTSPAPARSAPATALPAKPAAPEPPQDTSEEESGTGEEEAEPVEEEATGPCIAVEVTARGVPVVGARVKALRREEDGIYEYLEPLETGPDGRGQAWCQTGTYLLAASADGFAPTLLELHEGSTGPAAVAHFELTPGLTLSGRVLSRDSQEPVAEALITLYPSEGFSLPDVGLLLDETVIASTAQGKFRARDLSAGTYRVSVEAPGHTAKETMVSLPRAEPFNIELEDNCHLEGDVVDASGAPVPRAKVWVDSRGGAEDDSSPRADEHGHFSLEVDEGTYELSASAEGQMGAYDGAVTVARGGLVDGLVIHLRPASRISGHVFSQSTHAPIAEADVVVRMPGAAPVEMARTDKQGRFRFDYLLAGTYKLQLYQEGQPLLSREDLRVEAGQELSLELPISPRATVKGHLTDGLGKPVADAFVVAQPLDGERVGKPGYSTASSEEGAYTLAALPAGRYQLEARWQLNSKPLSRQLTLQDNEEAQADFTFTDKPGELQGSVQRASGGTPQQAVIVSASNPQSSESQVVIMEEDGHFTLKLLPGTYTLRAEYTDTEDAGPEQSITIEPGQPTPVRLTVPDAVTETSGLVLTSRGEPAAGATVTFVNGQQYEFEDTDARGHFVLRTSVASAGTAVTLVAEHEGEQGQVEGVRTGSQGTVIRLLKAAALRGRVSAPNGAPVHGFEVELVGDGSTSMSSKVGTRLPFAGDSFELVDLPPGALTLRLRTRDGRCGQAAVRLESGRTSTAEVTVGSTCWVEGDPTARPGPAGP